RLAPLAAVLGCKDQFALNGIEVALRPTVVAILLQQQQLFGWLRSLLLGFVPLRPICMQLVASVLSDEDVVGGIDHQSFRIADASGEALGRRECLVALIRVVAPDTAARIELCARIGAR